MMDGAPVFFCFPKYSDPVLQYPIGIPTINTIQFLQGIEVGKLVPVYSNMVFSFDIRNAVEWKGEPVKDLHIKIKDHYGYYSQ